MKESFEAVIFGRCKGAWKIIGRKRIDEVAKGLGWAQVEMQRLGTLQSYQRFRARVISSTDDNTAEMILASLRHAGAVQAAAIARAPRRDAGDRHS